MTDHYNNFFEYLAYKYNLSANTTDDLAQHIVEPHETWLDCYIDGSYSRDEDGVILDEFLFLQKIKKSELSDWIWNEFLEWRKTL